MHVSQSRAYQSWWFGFAGVVNISVWHNGLPKLHTIVEKPILGDLFVSHTIKTENGIKFTYVYDTVDTQELELNLTSVAPIGGSNSGLKTA